MKKILIICLSIILINSCKKNQNNKNKIEVCRCLSEPGNTEWAKKNKEKCNNEINKKIGVVNWQSINFSQNKKASEKWDLMIKECIDKKAQNDILSNSENNIRFEEAKKFIQQRCEKIGQKYIDGKTINSEQKITLYYFLSQNNEYTDYYCITGVSSRKLEVLGDVSCGKNEIIEYFNNIE